MSLRKKTLFSVVTVLTAMTLLEGSARVVRTARQQEPSISEGGPRGGSNRLRPRPVMRDDVLHHVWRPSHESLDTARELPYRLITNRQSWVEEYDVAIAKPANTYRIFYVGDSNTQGVVNREHKMVEIVETALNAEHSDEGRRFEVINAGTSSYSFVLYYLQIKNRILPYGPDLVVLNIDMTDVVNDYVYRKTMVTGADGEIQAVLPSAHIDTARYRMAPEGLVELSRVAPLYQGLIERSAFCYYLDRTLAHLRGTTHVDTKVKGVLDERANWLAQEWTVETTANVQKSMSVLRRTVGLLKSRGVKVMITGVPHYPQYTGEWSAKPHEVLAATAEEEVVPYLNSFTAVRDAAADIDLSDLYWPTDPTHFDIEGNKVWADVQLQFLTDPQNDLLSRNTEPMPRR